MAPGCEHNKESGVPLVMKLNKSLYGFRQSPTNWFSTTDHHLGKIGSRSLKLDPCVYVYEDENGSAILTLYVDDVLLHWAPTSSYWTSSIKKKLVDRFEMTDMGDVSRVLGMNRVTRDREEGIITMNQRDYTEDIFQRYGMRGCHSAYNPGVGPEMPHDQPKENLLNEESKRRYQSITDAAMYLAQVCPYDILYTANQLVRAMSKPFKAHMAAAKHQVRFLAGSTDFSIPYKQRSFKLAVFADANWRANPDNGKSTSSYIIMLSNGPIICKVGIDGSTVHSTMEAELVAAALTMKEAVICSNMMLELCFKGGFGSVPLYIDNTWVLHVADSRTYTPRAKHIALRYFFVQEIVEEGNITIHFVKTQNQIADLGTKHTNKDRHSALIKLMRELEA